MSDLISRQAAIDALNSLQKFSLMDSNEYLHGVGVRLKFAIQKLEQLPSAEPEIIYCKDCVHHIDGFFCRQANHHTSDKEHCASVFRAERREE